MADSSWNQKLSAVWRNKMFRTLLLINLAGIMERSDEALLPAVYNEIGSALHVGPSRLGSLTLLRSVVQMLCYPLAAYLCLHHHRAKVIAVGALFWAIATVFVGVSSTFVEVAISRALNGIGLAMVIPAIQSMVADATNEGNRGLAFGWLQFSGNLGAIIGNVCAVLLASTTVFGLAGWRVSFHLIAILSVLVAFFVYTFAVDPRFTEDMVSTTQNKHSDDTGSRYAALKETLQEAKRVIKIPTFLVIVSQGVAGNFPWAAMSFAPMWLELIGFSHIVTAVMMGLFIASNSLGGLFGGRLGDIFAQRFPNSGRIILAQFSSGIGIPLGAVLLLGLPDDPSTAIIHGAVLFIVGFLISWCGTATNNPIFAEIVPERSRTSIYALDRSFESVLASFAPLLVGILAEHAFGYVSSPHAAAVNSDRKNAASLAKALYVAFGVPFTFCCLIYSLLYWTYPKDRDKAKADSMRGPQIEISGLDELNQKPGYVSLKEEANTESNTESVQVQEGPVLDDWKTSEEVHMLTDTNHL